MLLDELFSYFLEFGLTLLSCERAGFFMVAFVLYERRYPVG